VAQLFSLGVIAHAMKKIITIGTIAAILVVISFLCWRHLATFNDDEIRSNLAGKWVGQYSPSVLFTIRQDGSYTSEKTEPSGKIITQEGIFRIEDGYMISTVTKYDGTTLPVPAVSRNRVIRADVHEIVINDVGNVRRVLRKDTP